MQANSPSSYAASLALHALVAAVLFYLTWWVARQQEVPPVIFELVPGAPTDMNATEAATTAKLEVDLPKIKPLDPAITRPRPEPEQIVEPPKQEIKTPPKPEPKKTETKKTEVKKAEPPTRVSYGEFIEQHGKPVARRPPRDAAPIKAPRITTDDIVRDIMRGGQGGATQSRPEQDMMATYFARLVRALQLAHEKPPGLSDQLEAQVAFSVAVNGDISDVRIARSSGDRDFDQSALDAFKRVGSIGPTPNRKAGSWTIRFRVRDE